MRRTMLPPILPSPTKPICVMFWSPRSGVQPALLIGMCALRAPFTGPDGPDRSGESAQRAGGDLARERHPLGRQSELAQRLQVPDRLRVLERGERVDPPHPLRDLDVDWAVVDQLQEAPGPRAAPVRLAHGV